MKNLYLYLVRTMRWCKRRLAISFASTIASPQERIYKNKSRRAPAITRGRLRRVLICLREHTRDTPSRVCVRDTFHEFTRKFMRPNDGNSAQKSAMPASPTPAVNLVARELCVSSRKTLSVISRPGRWNFCNRQTLWTENPWMRTARFVSEINVHWNYIHAKTRFFHIYTFFKSIDIMTVIVKRTNFSELSILQLREDLIFYTSQLSFRKKKFLCTSIQNFYVLVFRAPFFFCVVENFSTRKWRVFRRG